MFYPISNLFYFVFPFDDPVMGMLDVETKTLNPTYSEMVTCMLAWGEVTIGINLSKEYSENYPLSRDLNQDIHRAYVFYCPYEYAQGYTATVNASLDCVVNDNQKPTLLIAPNGFKLDRYYKRLDVVSTIEQAKVWINHLGERLNNSP